MDYIGKYLQKDPGMKYSILAIFLVSPLSSAQLFEAAGLMKTIALKPLLAAFAVGRTISYSTYVSGAALVAASDFGAVAIQQLKSPWAIATQIAMIVGVVLLGNVDWQKRLTR
jgi:hypothetical protein